MICENHDVISVTIHCSVSYNNNKKFIKLQCMWWLDRAMWRTWTLLLHRQKKDLRSTRTSKCQTTVFSCDDKLQRLTYSLTSCSTEGCPRLHRVPLQRGILCCCLIFAANQINFSPSNLCCLRISKDCGSCCFNRGEDSRWLSELALATSRLWSCF